MARLAESSDQRYRALVESSRGLICTHDLAGILLSVNPAAADRLGYPADELIGRSLGDFLAPSVRAQFPQYLDRIGHAASDQGLMLVVTRDGEERIEETARIAREAENVVAVKVASGANIRRYEQVLRGMRALPRPVSVLATSSLFQHFITGADGALTGFANFAPDFCVNLFNAVREGNLDRARELHEINWALEAAVYKAPNVYKHSRYKVAAFFAGLMNNFIVRPPQVPVPEGEVKLIHDAMVKLGMVKRPPL